MAVDYRGTAMTITARELQYRQSLQHQGHGRTRYREDGFSGALLAHLLPQNGTRWRDGTRTSA
jgi:hypothetical protein